MGRWSRDTEPKLRLSILPRTSGDPLLCDHTPFRQHKLALLAVTDQEQDSSLQTALSDAAHTAKFGEFLLYHKLGSLWYRRLLQSDCAGRFPPDLLEVLRVRGFAESALYAAQKSYMRMLDSLFDSRGIPYAIIKGAHLREVVYPDPALRVAHDIDVLVRPDDREAAARALVEFGMELRVDLDNISHQACFLKGPIAIDLHWDILRPGRTRVTMTELLLSRRARLDGFYALDETDAVFLMLVHPAFNRYVCSPTMTLCSVVDFLLWIRARSVNWSDLITRLEDAGVKTAAWAQLAWFAMLVDRADWRVPAAFMSKLKPGSIRSWYVSQWLQHDLPTRLFARPVLIQVGFTLAFHDRPSGLFCALRGWQRSRHTYNDPVIKLMNTEARGKSRGRGP